MSFSFYCLHARHYSTKERRRKKRRMGSAAEGVSRNGRGKKGPFGWEGAFFLLGPNWACLEDRREGLFVWRRSRDGDLRRGGGHIKITAMVLPPPLIFLL